MIKTIAAAAAALAALTISASADPLPFPDGRYVNDRALCAMTMDQIVTKYGDQTGGSLRIIEGKDLSDGYDGVCKVSGVKSLKGTVTFKSTCVGEGDPVIERERWTQLSPTAFKDRGKTYEICPRR